MTNKVRTMADIIGAMAWLTLLGGMIGLLLVISEPVVTKCLVLSGTLWIAIVLWGAAYGLRMMVTLRDRQVDIEKRLDYLIKQQMRSKSRG